METSGIKAIGQVVAGGPVYPSSNIMLSYFKIFTTAKEKLYITNPYFIPNDSILDALKQAAISGVDVRLMIPYKSDSLIVGAAARFYFPELVQAGAKIYLYKKGFVHAKTVVADSCLSVIGTANMDMRSFDLNFEIMSVIYGQEFGALFEKTFINDLKECVEVTNDTISHASLMSRLFFSIARLMSSFL
jgi:cardiolipin synthase